MEKQTIKFSISQDGSVTEEVIGVTGTQCLDLTEKIEDLHKLAKNLLLKLYLEIKNKQNIRINE